MAAEDGIPGVTLEFKHMKELGGTGQKRFQIELLARVFDMAIWDDVKKKIQDGIRVHAVGDFSSMLNEVLRQDNKRLERQLNDLQRELRDVRERSYLAQAALEEANLNIEALADQNKEMKAALSVIGHELSV